MMKINRKYSYIVSQLRHHRIFDKCEIVNLYKIFRKLKKIQTLKIFYIDIIDNSKYIINGLSNNIKIEEDIDVINKRSIVMLSKIDRKYLKDIQKLAIKYRKKRYDLIKKRLLDVTKIELNTKEERLNTIISYIKNLKILKINSYISRRVIDQIKTFDKLEIIDLPNFILQCYGHSFYEKNVRGLFMKKRKMKYINLGKYYIWINHLVKDSEWIKKKHKLLNNNLYTTVKNKYGREYIKMCI